MKLLSGTLANQPHPATGLVAILIRHREALEPGNKITGNAAVQLLALARAIVEGLGGKARKDGQWEAELGGSGDDNNVARLLESVTKLDEAQGGIEDKFDREVAAIRQSLEAVRLMPPQDQRPGPIINGERDPNQMIVSRAMLDEALDRIAALEAMATAPIEGITLEAVEQQPDPRIAVLEQRNADLERTVEDLAAAVSRMESRAKPGPKPRG